MNSSFPVELAVPSPLVSPVVLLLSITRGTGFLLRQTENIRCHLPHGFWKIEQVIMATVELFNLASRNP